MDTTTPQTAEPSGLALSVNVMSLNILKCVHSLKLFCFILSDIRLVEEPTEDDAKMYNNNDYIDDDLTNIEGIYLAFFISNCIPIR